MSDITHREIREHYEHNPHCFFVLFWGKKNKIKRHLLIMKNFMMLF